VLLHLHPGPVQQNLDYVALFGSLVYGVCAQAPALCERHTAMQNRYSKDNPPPSFSLLWPPATRRAVTWTAQQWNQRVQVGSKIIYWPVAGEPQARMDWTQGEAVGLPYEEIVVPTGSSGRVSIGQTLPLVDDISEEQARFIVFRALPALYGELEEQLENSASTEAAMQRIFAMRKGIETAMGMVGYGTATSLWLQKLLDLDVDKANQGTRERALVDDRPELERLEQLRQETLRPEGKAVPRIQELQADEARANRKNSTDNLWEGLRGLRSSHFRAEFSDAEGNVLNTWRFTIHNYTLQACQRIALEMSMAVVASDEGIESVSVTCETTGRVCVDDRGF